MSKVMFVSKTAVLFRRTGAYDTQGETLKLGEIRPSNLLRVKEFCLARQ